jgi:hypothetical protein
VNIRDFDEVKATQSEDRLDSIFARQRELMQKYDVIERGNGFFVPDELPLNLHDSKHQQRIKDFAWRISEEIGEALEAFDIHPDDPDHCDEEIADAFHFLVELTILVDYKSDRLIGGVTDTMPRDRLNALYVLSGEGQSEECRTYFSLTSRAGILLKNLACMCNTLKNKPWKQSQMTTDVEYFYECLQSTWFSFIRFCAAADIGGDYLFDLYFRKSLVNEFRQDSEY